MSYARVVWPGSVRGEPQWGTFRIASPDPNKTLVGAVGFGAITTLANGGQFLTKAPDYANPSESDFAVVHSEQRIEIVTDTSEEADALMGAASLEEFTKSASAIITTERAVIAHNQADPKNPFVAIPFLDGAASVPIVVTPKDPNNADAKAFADHFATPAAAAALRQAGFRGVMGELPSVGTSALAKRSTGPFPFTAEMLAGVRRAWSVMHARSSTLAVIDLSGSMRNAFDPSRSWGGPSRSPKGATGLPRPHSPESATSLTLAQLQAFVQKTFDKNRPVAINFFLIDPGVHLEPLQRIAELTGGTAAHVTLMSQVPDAFAQALFSAPK